MLEVASEPRFVLCESGGPGGHLSITRSEISYHIEVCMLYSKKYYLVVSIDLKGNITKMGQSSLILLKQKGGRKILTLPIVNPF